MRQQLLIALVRRLGGTVEISVDEIDDSERFKLIRENALGGRFRFTVVEV